MSVTLLQTPWTVINDFVDEIKLQPEEKQLALYFKANGPIKSIIDSFDFFLNNRWPLVTSRHNYINDNERVYAIHEKYSRAKTADNKEDPTAFRDLGESYTITSSGTWYRDTRIGGEWKAKPFTNTRPLATFLLMVGSQYCWTRGKTAQQLLAVGISDVDPLAYFVVKGRERTIQCQEKLAFNRILVAPFYAVKSGVKKPAAQISVNTITGTKKY